MIMGMFKHTKTYRAGMWMAGAAASLLYPASAYAANGLIFTTQSTIAEGVSWLLTAINLLTWMLFGFLTYLLDPRFMFGLTEDGQSTAFMDMLNQIWQLSRDVTNIGFAIILVGAAVMMTVMANKDYVADKAKGFVMVVILVNFSWFIPRVILDVANISTATIFGIPSLIGQDGNNACEYTSAFQGDNCTANGDGSFKCKCVVITNMKVFVDNWEDLDGTDGWSCIGNALFCYKSEAYTPGTVSNFSAILNGLIVNHGRLRELGQVPRNLQGSDRISELIVFVVREIILVVFHIALFFPLLAMTVAFFIRIPTLWITIAFMPFFFLGKVLPEQVKKFTGDALDGIMENFVKAAFLPAAVAVPLSIGYIMINAGSRLPSTATQVRIALFPGVTNLWELLWMCMSLGVLWVGVFKVLSESGGMIEKTSEVIKSTGQAAGTAAFRGIPVTLPGGMKMNMGQLGDSIKKGLSGGGFSLPQPKTVSTTETNAAAKKFQGKPADVTKLTKEIGNLTTAIKAGNKEDASKALKGMNKISGNNVAGTDNTVSDLENLLKKMIQENGGASTPEMNDLRDAIKDLKAAGPKSDKFAAAAAVPRAERLVIPANPSLPGPATPGPTVGGMDVGTIASTTPVAPVTPSAAPLPPAAPTTLPGTPQGPMTA